MSRGNDRRPSSASSELEVLKKVDEMITYAYSAVRHFQRLYARGEVELDEVRQSVVSWSAHASHADTHGLQHKLLAQYPLRRAA